MRCFGRRLGTDRLALPEQSEVWVCGLSAGLSEVPHGVPLIESTSTMAVRYGDTPAMTADGRVEPPNSLASKSAQSSVADRQSATSSVALIGVARYRQRS